MYILKGENRRRICGEMGSLVEETEGQREYDVAETIFVAVGKNVEKSKTTLFWAVHNFPGKMICLLHVHQPTHEPALNGKLAHNKLKQHVVEAPQKLERQKMQELLDEYLLILDHAGAQADTVWIEMDSVENGIVEIIARHSVRWLVMGAAADKYYSKKLVEVKSKKAIFVCQKAPVSCHTWFTCKGCLIYTRIGRKDGSNIEIATLSPPLDSSLLTEKLELLLSESVFRVRSIDVEEDTDVMGGKLRPISLCSEHPNLSNNGVVDSYGSIPLLMDKEEGHQGRVNNETDQQLELSIMDDHNLKQKVFAETVKQWKEENDCMEAICKEMSQRREMEEFLERKKQEIQKVKDQHDEFMKELLMVKGQRPVLESQIAESKCTEKELEEKIISAVELLISFKKKRDDMRMEHGNAIRVLKHLKKSVNGEDVSFPGTEILEFSFMEINNATRNFDPSWKIGEGKYGSVYKGLLRHVHVAIKMLPSYGSQSLLEFENEVEILSRVRHPNLITMIGTCPESRSLVFEYLRNGSLEDRLACKNNTPPLPWQTRTRIASEICSALIFLHSNKPCIPHGNLKPSKVLLDANFVSKLSDSGIYRLIPQRESTAISASLCTKSNPKVASVYMDPKYLENGQVTRESDVYSFGMILLRLLTGRPALGILKDVKCAIETENFNMVLDWSAGDWPLEEAQLLAHSALRCCEKQPLNRLDLVSEIWSVLGPMRDLCIESVSSLGAKEPRRIPSHFVCPIFQEVMKDPLIAADGFTYEGDAIRGWLESGHDTSPMTNLKLEHCSLVPNYALHQAIQEWQHAQY
ncbi:U-box domain-containing protein 32-like isoform X2 [Durio zibethinus]|uniref:RING-type E3 ubiquitin transferase n=1 Tax=Durio zibethinus TaxID=66656 RepID=A0A6P6AIM9_DURZI|nr:U-box domain-containing protein 32-like isoform X2 [Durio zibethinus]